MTVLHHVVSREAVLYFLLIITHHMFAASMQNMILEALQLTLNNALDGSTALEAEIANYPELLKVS